MSLRNFRNLLAVVYITIGAGLGGYMQSLIPAMNWFGVAYYALTWPAYPICHYAGCDPMPPQWVSDFMFSTGGDA